MASPGLSEAEARGDEPWLPLPDRTVPDWMTQPGGADHSITSEWNWGCKRLDEIEAAFC